LYNLLCDDINEGQNKDMIHVMSKLNKSVDACGLLSVFSDANKKNSKKRVRRDDDDGTGRGGGGRDHAQLRAQHYEVKSDVIVDDQGIELEPISKVPVNPFLPLLRYADARH
jgi:hypothetical protein